MAGEAFGEKTILQEDNSLTAVACRGIAEILRVDNDDIDQVRATAIQAITEK